MKRSQVAANEIGSGCTLWRHVDSGLVVAVNDSAGDSWAAVFFRGTKRIGALSGLRPPQCRVSGVNDRQSDDELVAEAAVTFGSYGPTDCCDRPCESEEEQRERDEWCAVQAAFAGSYSDTVAVKAVRE